MIILELEGTLWIIESSPSYGGTVESPNPNLWLHNQMFELLSRSISVYRRTCFRKNEGIVNKHVAEIYINGATEEALTICHARRL